MTSPSSKNAHLDDTHLQELVLYRDGLMLVLNKPSGIPVHKGKGPYKPFEDYFEAYRYGMHQLPCLAHRLDRETSGCLVLGRHPKALRHLGHLFAENRIDKTYLALVHGIPPEKTGRIDLPLSQQSDKKYEWHMKADPDGKPSVTLYEVLHTFENLSLISLTPLTGRTHQLRVHCDAAGFPIVGDSLYYSNRASDRLSPALHLHAYRVTIPYNSNKAPITATAPLPPHIGETLGDLGLSATHVATLLPPLPLGNDTTQEIYPQDHG